MQKVKFKEKVKFKAKVEFKAKSGIQSKKWNSKQKMEFKAKSGLYVFNSKIPLCQIGSNSLMIQFKPSKGKQKTKKI